MEKTVKPKVPDAAREKECESFLLKELDLMESEIKRLRAEGPSRLQFLFTITSCLLGSLLVLAGLKSIEAEWVRRAGIVTSLLLFAFSLVTYDYLISRDISCDRNARATARIRQYFLARSPSLLHHISWQTTDAPTQWIRADRSAIRRMAIFIASSACGLFVGLLVFELSSSIGLSYVTSAVAASVNTILFRYWAHKRLAAALDVATREQRFNKHSRGDS